MVEEYEEIKLVKDYEFFKTDWKWIKYLDLSRITPFALQFANCQRILSNDTVYLFDEVGAGKTISAGLMAMMCLEKYDKQKADKTVELKSNGKILIISTPGVAGHSKEGKNSSFWKKWYSRDPDVPGDGIFTQVIRLMGWEDRIEITNNWFSNLEKYAEKKEMYSLVIVDEADIFLKKSFRIGNNDFQSKRRASLENIRCDKVVFATATPIREYGGDLEEYAKLSNLMRNKDDAINPLVRLTDTKELICCSFDPECCVTRYFKDTIRRAKRRAKEENVNVTRQEMKKPWKWDNDIEEKAGCTEYDALAKKVIAEQNCETSEPKKFIIFTDRQIDAENIGKAFNDNGYRLVSEDNDKKKSYAVVFGNSSDLIPFTDKIDENSTVKKISTDVLITTYQLAEAGMNFQRFNCILNYHISRYPSRLEQRFGRIDRLDSDYKKIYMYYWIGKKPTSESNYLYAHRTYLIGLIPIIPVRNVLLTSYNLNSIRKFQNIKNMQEQIRNIICDLNETQDEVSIKDIENKINSMDDIDAAYKDEMIEAVRELFNTNGGEIDIYKIGINELLDSFFGAFGYETNKKLTEMDLKKGEIIVNAQDAIFYYKKIKNQSPLNIASLTLEECYERIDNKTLRDFQKLLDEKIKIPYYVEFFIAYYGKALNEELKKLYSDNLFYKLFPVEENSAEEHYLFLLRELIKNIEKTIDYDVLRSDYISNSKNSDIDDEELRSKIKEAKEFVLSGRYEFSLIVKDRLQFFKRYNFLRKKINVYSFRGLRQRYEDVNYIDWLKKIVDDNNRNDKIINDPSELFTIDNGKLKACALIKMIYQAAGNNTFYNFFFTDGTRGKNHRKWARGIVNYLKACYDNLYCDDIWTARIISMLKYGVEKGGNLGDKWNYYSFIDDIWKENICRIDQTVISLVNDTDLDRDEYMIGLIPKFSEECGGKYKWNILKIAIDKCISDCNCASDCDYVSDYDQVLDCCESLYLKATQSFYLNCLEYTKELKKITQEIFKEYITRENNVRVRYKGYWNGEYVTGYKSICKKCYDKNGLIKGIVHSEEELEEKLKTIYLLIDTLKKMYDEKLLTPMKIIEFKNYVELNKLDEEKIRNMKDIKPWISWCKVSLPYYAEDLWKYIEFKESGRL